MAKWVVLFHEDFDLEFEALPEDVQDVLLAHARMLKNFGPTLGAPGSTPSTASITRT